MRLRLKLLLGLVVGSLLVTNVALAQKKSDDGPASRRQGFWWGIGLGAGSAGLECDGCSTDREGSGSGYLRMGGRSARTGCWAASSARGRRAGTAWTP